MADLLGLVLAHINDPTADAHLETEVAAHVAAVKASAGGGVRGLVAHAEKAVQANPEAAFAFDANRSAMLTVGDRRWAAGHFEALSLAELRVRVQRTRGQGAAARVRLSVFDGASPATDIGGLQATSGHGSVFQVASQFNCLESPGPYVTQVAKYFQDPTQGPRASVSAFPATLLRHYHAPGGDGQRFVQQTDGSQIDLLSDACGPGAARNGYFSGEGIANPRQLVQSLEDNFEAIRVGVHDGAQVVLGYSWDGLVEEGGDRCVAQIFTSTVAGGAYGARNRLGSECFAIACRQLLRAAYLGTLLAAVSLGRNRVVLTLIGGGVFGNPVEQIWDAIQWAVTEVVPCVTHDLDVVVNGYNLGGLIDLDQAILPAVRKRGGAILSFNSQGLAGIRR